MGSRVYVPDQIVGYIQADCSTLQNISTLIAALPGNPDPAAGPYYLKMRAEVQNIRIRDDGTAPTTAVGYLISTTDPIFEWEANNLANLQAIAVTAGGLLNILVYRRRVG